MSVFELECAEAASGLICQHIQTFYPNQVGDPVMFCILSDEDLPEVHTVIPVASTTGDECHRDIDATNSAFAKTFKNRRGWQLFKTCENGAVRDLVEADLAEL